MFAQIHSHEKKMHLYSVYLDFENINNWITIYFTGSRTARSSQLVIEEDCDIAAKAGEVYEAERQVKDQLWKPENHDLNEGKYMRGRKEAPTISLDPKTGSQWLSFRGGLKPDKESGGIVEAFTGRLIELFE